MTAKLAQTIAELIEREGGYVNDPSDRGGETTWGVTAAVARAFGYAGPMRDMSTDVAIQIYIQRYWTQPRFDRVAELSEAIAEELLDTGVNMGTSTAGKFLQRALNALNQQGKTWPDLEMDGNLGAMSLSALKIFLSQRGAEGELTLLRMLNGQQSVRYIEIAERDQVQERFSYGWQLNRVI